MVKRAPRIATAWMVAGCLTALPARADSVSYHLDLGAGGLIPFNDRQREIFGPGPAFMVGAATELAETDTWAFVELGHQSASGIEDVSDPTFDVGETTYRIIPIALGVRVNLVRHPDLPVAFFLGAAWQTVFTTWKSPFGESESTPTFGAAFEFRPAITLGDRWSAWVRQRLTALSDADYGAGIGSFNYSGAILDAGLSFQLGAEDHE